jgi:lysophospholipase L1-like esterase
MLRKKNLVLALVALLVAMLITHRGAIASRDMEIRGAGLLTTHPAIVHPGVVTTDPAAFARLEAQKAILNAQGVTNLSALGTLTISGTVVPQPGFVRAPFVRNWTSVASTSSAQESSRTAKVTPKATPQAPPSAQAPTESAFLKPSNMTTAPTVVHNARGLRASGAGPVIASRGKDISVPAVKIIGEPLVVPAQNGGGASKATAALPIGNAYWVGNSINLPNNTTIVIQPNVRYLTIIANTITIGSNVTLTYQDVPVMNPPLVPGKPSTVPDKPLKPHSFGSTGGSPGYSGTQPPQVGTPPDAPQVELWTLAMNQLPTVILKGQHGYKGVQGGGGGDGGPGGDGTDSICCDWLGQCKSGPGAGADGGKGGRGGNGGLGGNGGNGGLWSLYAPSLPTSMTIDVSGGERGDGGDPGDAGIGGPGGSRGVLNGSCGSQGRGDGTKGQPGDPGVKGSDGAVGVILPNSINQVVIDATDFNNKLNDPAIQHVYPEYPNTATVGSTITIDGLNFTATDTVTVGGVSSPTQFFSDTMLQATVPDTWGAVAQVRVVRAGNGPTSNRGTLYIKPVILSTVPPSPSSRLKPGTTVVVNGSGFSPQMSVRVNHEDIASVSLTSSTTLFFVMVRPASIPYNPHNARGEPAILSVASNGPIIESDSIPIVIATFQMLVLGDSVIWGEGLQDPDKIHSLVEAHEKTLHPGMSVYKTVLAHSGAILSWNASISGTAHDGDISQDYPSIQQQANAAASLPNASTVDLILVTGCANDVGFQNFLNVTASQTSIANLVQRYCLGDMTAFLQATANQFPAATIVVADYYQGVSLETDPYFINVVAVLYGLQDNQGLAPKALAAWLGSSPAAIPIVAGNAGYFASQANMQLGNAVAAANSSLTSPRIFFADPGFGPTNAANASNPWLFGLRGHVVPGPTDSSAALSRRENQCSGIYSKTSIDYMFCRLASAGHPNETGAVQYFNAIKPFL